jgi:hypothetical protein
MSDARFLQVGVDGVDGLLFGPEAILSFLKASRRLKIRANPKRVLAFPRMIGSRKIFWAVARVSRQQRKVQNLTHPARSE